MNLYSASFVTTQRSTQSLTTDYLSFVWTEQPIYQLIANTLLIALSGIVLRFLAVLT